MTRKEPIVPILREIGGKVHGDHIDKTRWSLPGDAKLWPDHSTTVSADEVLGAILGDVAIDVFDGDVDAIVAFIEVFHATIKEDPTGIPRFGVVSQNRLHSA